MSNGRQRTGRWLSWVAARLLALLLLPGLLSSCETTSDLGAEFSVDPVSGTVYVDTFTVRTSTVLIDSVETSSSNYLLVGQYTDARLGTITARSYVRLGLGSGAFMPDVMAQYDSLTLTLPTDTYRYGDTTHLQHVQVHQLKDAIRPAQKYYSISALPYNATPLGTHSFLPKSGLGSLRLRLSDALGQQLLQAGIRRQISSDAELEALLPGLVLAPASADNAALVRFLATSTDLVLQLHCHLPAAPTEAVSYSFTALSGERHFYQLQADRRSTLLSTLSASRQSIPSTLTAAETYVQGGLGLQTKVEIPYLLNLNMLGRTWVINGATLTLETVNGSENHLLPAPSTLTAQTTNRANQPGTYLAEPDGTQLLGSYSVGTSPRTNLEQGSYTFALQPYLEALLKREVANEGILLAPNSLDTPERVVLGGSGHATNPIRLGLYLTRVQ
ncbi:DUF4270 family protein [Hymenobacter tenuis]